VCRFRTPARASGAGGEASRSPCPAGCAAPSKIGDPDRLPLTGRIGYEVDPENECPANDSGHLRVALKNGCMREVMQRHLTDMSKKAEMDEVWCEWIPDDGWPCRACVGTTLAPGDLVEIKVTAVK
jgi:hypothetical protein